MRPLRFFPVLAAGIMMYPSSVALGAPPADDKVRSVVDERVTEWWPKPEEKRFDQIGWAADISTARKLSEEHNRPLFLFTMDGRVNLGRC